MNTTKPNYQGGTYWQAVLTLSLKQAEAMRAAGVKNPVSFYLRDNYKIALYDLPECLSVHFAELPEQITIRRPSWWKNNNDAYYLRLTSKQRGVMQRAVLAHWFETATREEVAAYVIDGVSVVNDKTSDQDLFALWADLGGTVVPNENGKFA